MEQFFAYIDESGDVNFNESASEIFFLGGVVFKKEYISNVQNALYEIKKELGVNELKSSKIGRYERRKNAIAKLSRLEIECITIWVNKKQLLDSSKGDWYRYKKSFYKFMQRLVIHDIYRLFRNTTVNLDQYGSDEYQQSLIDYLVDNLQGDLFNPQIHINSSKNETLIQVADILNGTFRKILKGDFAGNKEQELRSILEPIWISRKEIPRNYDFISPKFSNEEGEYVDIFLNEAKRFLDSNIIAEYDQRKVLEYLYFSALASPDDYIYRDEIIEWLKLFGISYGHEQFNNKITSPLRERGLVIIGTRKGLKIPTTLSDINEYINFVSNMAIPILRRLKIALTTVVKSTDNNKIDDLVSDELKQILDKINA